MATTGPAGRQPQPQRPSPAPQAPVPQPSAPGPSAPAQRPAQRRRPQQPRPPRPRWLMSTRPGQRSQLPHRPHPPPQSRPLPGSGQRHRRSNRHDVKVYRLLPVQNHIVSARLPELGPPGAAGQQVTPGRQVPVPAAPPQESHTPSHIARVRTGPMRMF